MTYDAWYRDICLVSRRPFLIDALIAAKGNVCKAAADLGIHRNSLHRFMREDAITSAMIKVMRRNLPVHLKQKSTVEYLSRNIYQGQGRKQSVQHQHST